jgi:hypothetical protein
MQLRPDELPDMTQDEVRAVTLNLASIAGANTVSAPSATCDTLTIGTPSIDGKDMTFTVTADQTGTHYILVSADLANGETVKSYIRVCVKGEPCVSVSDYND